MNLSLRSWMITSTMALALVPATLGACSSDSGTPAVVPDGDSGTVTDAARDTAAADAGGGADADDGNCVPVGTPSNEKGIGGYCSPGGGECTSDSGALVLCTADVGGPAGSYFCTTPCSSDAQCGTNAYCANDPRGRACVPNVCGSPPDAGADAARD